MGRGALWPAALAGMALVAAAAGARAAPNAAAPAWRVAARLSIAHVTAMATAPDGTLAAVASADPDRLTWISLPAGRTTSRTALPMPATAMTFDASGGAVVIAYGDCGPGPAACGSSSYVDRLARGATALQPVPTGSGSTLLAPVPGAGDTGVLVAADGAGTVSEIDAQTGAVEHTFALSSGVYGALAVRGDGAEALLSNVTAGAVVGLDLATGAVGPSVSVGGEVTALAFYADTNFAFAGGAAGDDVLVVDLATGRVRQGLPTADGVQALAYASAQNVVVAASANNEAAEDSVGFGGRRPILRAVLLRVPIAQGAAAGAAAVSLVDGGDEALALGPGGLLVLGGAGLTPTQDLTAAALGGRPTELASDGAAAALVATARGRVDVLALDPVAPHA